MQTLLTERARSQSGGKSSARIWEANFQAFIDCFDGYAWCIDSTRQYIFLNTVLRNRIREVLQQDVQPGDTAVNIPDLVYPGSDQPWDTIYTSGFAGVAQQFTAEDRSGGQSTFLEISIHPMREGDSVTALCCYARKLSPVVARNQLNEKKFRALIENGTDMFYMADEAGNFTYASPSVEKYLGYTESDCLGKFALSHVHDKCQEEARQLLSNVLNNPGVCFTFYLSLKHKDGREIPVEGLACNLLHVPEVNALLANFRDITERKKAERQIRESEEMYRNIFNSCPLPVCVCDSTTLRFLEVNEAAASTYGYTRRELLKMTLFGIVPIHEHDGLKQQLAAVSDNHERMQRNHVNRLGEEIAVELLVHRINFRGREAYLMLANDLTQTIRLQNRHIEEKLQWQQELIRASLDATEKERAHIGRELHDNVTQLLTTAKLCLSCVPDDPGTSDMIRRSMSSINAAIEEIRNLSKSMIQDFHHEVGLKLCIEDLVENIRVTDRFAFRLDFFIPDEHRMDDKLKLTIFRIIQEQLTNIIKHANATEISISLKQQQDQLELIIGDNGRGFRVSEKRKGIGITNITNRAALFNGRMRIDSSSGCGCRMKVVFPVNGR